MEIAIIVLVVLILIGVKAYVDQRNYKKRLRTRLLREWGRPSEDEYGIEKLQTVAEYFRAHENDQSIDDITWNDLDMDTVYQQMNIRSPRWDRNICMHCCTIRRLMQRT